MNKTLEKISPFAVPIAIVVGGLVVSGAIFASQNHQSKPEEQQTDSQQSETPVTAKTDDELLQEAGIDKESLQKTIEEADKEFNVTKNLNDKKSYLSGRFPKFDIDKELNEKYNVEGSPTLVINGKKVNPTSRTPDGYKEVICSAFKTAPEGCKTGNFDIEKTDKPVVELFVMSHCPYGKQAMNGIIPAIEDLGDKIDFELRFVYYAMHGEKEVRQQLEMYAIQKTQPDKLIPYLKVYLKSEGVSEQALSGSCN